MTEAKLTSGSDAEFAFEGWFRLGDHVLVQLTNGWNSAFILSLAYVIIVFGGQKFMEKRNKFDLRSPLILWSTFLALFSLMGTARVWKVGLQMYYDGGVTRLLCDNAFYDAPIVQFWSILFVYSKFLEYVDTVFIILRKQKLIFLHWYHHLTVALFCWLTFRGKYAGGFIFMALNYAVHAIMYTYYAIRAAGFRIPRQYAKIITASQILQMVIGCVTIVAIAMYDNQTKCWSSTEYVISGCVMYASYLALFVHFFYQTYIQKRPINEKHSKTNNRSTVTSQEKTNGHYATHQMNLRERKVHNQ